MFYEYRVRFKGEFCLATHRTFRRVVVLKLFTFAYELIMKMRISTIDTDANILLIGFVHVYNVYITLHIRCVLVYSRTRTRKSE